MFDEFDIDLEFKPIPLSPEGHEKLFIMFSDWFGEEWAQDLLNKMDAQYEKEYVEWISNEKNRQPD